MASLHTYIPQFSASVIIVRCAIEITVRVPAVRLSVCLSVTGVSCEETEEFSRLYVTPPGKNRCYT